MLRIIGGQQRGRKIDVPAGGRVRPPTDRVREAMFNLLRMLVAGRPAFDLFAGSGALGLEALSRGAAHATLVESDPRIVATLKRNVAHLHYEHATTIVVADVYRWVERSIVLPTSPAVVLIAPPYSHFERRPDDLGRLWTSLVREMPDDTAIVIQAPQNFERDALPAGADWELRRYGQTQVVIGQTCRTPSENSPSP
jgi:16S rRNA (guanine966-N2)-methyltransferase